MALPIKDCAAAVLAANLPVVCIDTCVWLDFFRGRQPAASVRKLLQDFKTLVGVLFLVVIPEQVQVEYNRNKGTARNSYERTLRYAAENYNKLLLDFQEVMGSALPNMTGDFATFVENRYVFPVDKILKSVMVMEPAQVDYAKGAQRACLQKAPSAEKGKSIADCVIVESFMSLVDVLRAQGYKRKAYFVTANTSDFSDPTNPVMVHPDLQSDFNRLQIVYETNMSKFVYQKSY